MTGMLASVASGPEADAAIRGGADIVDFKDPARGALGALPVVIIAEMVAARRGQAQFSAVTGDLPMQPALLVSAAEGMARTGVDFVKLGLFPDPAIGDCIRALAPLARHTPLIAVLFADLAPDLSVLPLLAECGFRGAMLDTARKGAGRLLTVMDLPAIADFVSACARHGLMSGLSGSLEAPDVPRLLALEADYLGFRGALCDRHDRKAGLDDTAFSLIRALIPARNHASAPARVDWRLLSARGYSQIDEARQHACDQIFVHDLVLPVEIGAYDFEHGIAQQVRFNIECDVPRKTGPGDDMRRIVSYDLIHDAIALVLARGHIAMAETLAEEISQALLKDERILRTHVRIEKLDVIKGTVGVAIRRERSRQPAQITHLLPARPDRKP